MACPKCKVGDWVLQQRGDALAGWYYCGGGNPFTLTVAYAVGYHSRQEAREMAAHLKKHEMGTFIPRKRAKEMTRS